MKIAGFHCWLLLMLALLLTSCMDVAMTGAQAVYNRRSIQSGVTDQYITMQAHKTLQVDHDHFKDTNIVIATYNQEVLLTGQAPASWQRKKAEQLVKQIPEVKEIHNLIAVAPVASTVTKLNDAWITTKIKTKLIASDEVDVSQIKVLTENGNVYLMGILQPEHAAAAVELASNTDGVQRVVKIFSYIRVTKKL
ncbi:MAG TPA: BON domain-containing protein [Gammaproteobacteria bacterium]|jgi:osmotically-inducible protein OsmY|nr:BON domain-containing protein [Gammaproteobacteria bacterium]